MAFKLPSPELNIPTISGDSIQLSLGAGDRIFIVGANGSGKSALIQHFVSSNNAINVRRVPAHRQTSFHSDSIDITLETRLNLQEEFHKEEQREQARWIDRLSEKRQSAILFDLVDQANLRARRIARQVDNQEMEEAARTAAEMVSPFDQINELLALGSFAVRLELRDPRHRFCDEIVARHSSSNDAFSIAQMSDGERNAVVIAATVLSVHPGFAVAIDEPERHLHPSKSTPFLSALFQKRTDCSFVVSTNDIALPVAHPEARVLLVRSCKWRGSIVEAWDLELLESNTTLPENLKLALLGSRERILFVEGDNSGSLDLPLYNALFPGISIVPKGGCADVLRAVNGLRRSEDLHHVEAFGLIDRDNRPSDEVKQLASEHVYALDVFSVEALYFCSDAVAAVAQHQAESLLGNGEAMIEFAKGKALEALKEAGLSERMAARRCERHVRNSMFSKTPDWKSILTNPTEPICASFPSPFPDELKRFQALLADSNLDALVARYPLRECRVFDVIANALQLTGRATYKNTLLSRLRGNATLAQCLRQRVKSLSEALGM